MIYNYLFIQLLLHVKKFHKENHLKKIDYHPVTSIV